MPGSASEVTSDHGQIRHVAEERGAREKVQPLHVQPVTTGAQLEGLRSEWQELWLRDPKATPFQSPSWLIPWWHHLGQGELLSLALRDHNEKLVGFLPLYVHRPQSGRRVLAPIGIATSDYLDGVFEPEAAFSAVSAAFAHLDTLRDRWDCLKLDHLRASSPLLRTPAPTEWLDDTSESAACPVLILPESVEALLERLPPRMVENLLFYRRRAAKLGQVEWSRADASSLEEIWEAHVSLHHARWRTRGTDGVLAEHAVVRAHRESLPQLLSDDMLRLYALRLDGRIVATLHGLLGTRGPDRRFYYYLAGFNPELEKLSPGTLLIGHAVQEAIAEGCRVFDFLSGQESYKYLWGAVDTRLHRRDLRHTDSANLRGAGDPEHPAPGLAPEPREVFSVRLDGVVRPCQRDDLPTLQWFSMFDRELIADIFTQHQRGEALMLVAEVNSVPSGQVWVALHPSTSSGFLWAIRVFPSLQRRGIGTRLVGAAERALIARGYAYCDLSIEPENLGAQRLYERLGYELLGSVPLEGGHNNRGREPIGAMSQLFLRKRLAEQGGPRESDGP
jgi:CelD/BcsL family acetyltransferase involved in cellulose biosynthesis/GNAT superfamily N-acetyltransferase